MAATKSNGASGGERRRRSRTTNGAAAGQGAASASGGEAERWLGRLDALVDRLAGLDDRAAIIDQMVAEAMQLLPADEVRVYADASTITAPSFIDENEGAPARAVIPLAIAGRHFGAVEITMKPQHAVRDGERALAVALVRQCALVIDGLSLRQSRRAADAAATPGAEVARAAGQSVVDAPVVEIAPAASVIEIAPAQAPAPNLEAVRAALTQLEADVRALAKLAQRAA